MKSGTIVPTPYASRYLQKLCKHFAHKIETRFDAQEDTLTLTIAAEDEKALSPGQEVIWTHLVRFAFREDLGTPDWRIVPEV